MRFQHYWMSEVDFDFYVQGLYNASIIDRGWMEPEVTSFLKKKKHVLLSAQLGYGKSSTVSQILCAEVYSHLNRIKTMTVAYHMCRFNHKDSTQSSNFIRNLAGKIVNDVPELGNAILADVYVLDYLGFKCEKDPFSCLEVVIIAPLKSIKTDSKYLVIIDALDECDTPMGNDLYDLLAKKLTDFPSFFQFLFTSRKINKVLYEFKTLQNIIEIDLDSFKDRNVLDAIRFIDLTSNLTVENKVQLVNVSDGNLLLVYSYLDYCRGNVSCEFSKVPNTLEYINHANLERIVGSNGTSFEDWTAIFEVLCVAVSPIKISELFEMTGLYDDKQKRKFSLLLSNEFGHFLKTQSNKLSFQHKAFKDFLINESRKHLHFYINITKGHTLFSRYYLHLRTPQILLEEKDLVDIAYHVALTYNKQIAETFLQLYNRTNLQNDKILYYLAREVNCYDTANLVIQLVNQSGISSLIMSVAAFTASANGNLKTLILFLGNNFNFKSEKRDIIQHTMKGADLVYMCKFVIFCGYNVFHIAAQRGYVEIVEYLLEYYPDIIYELNKIQLNAFQLAAENGHTRIVKLFLGINSSLADHHSLYYASQQGHTKIVSLLLKYVNDTCLPCNGTIYWLPSLSFRKQKYITYPIEALNKNSVHFHTIDFLRIDQILSNAILSDD
ncbi:Hypothetical predicted protein [Mytilus galloprovincialis]|uniref:NACHT domain-containing protein n=1 Tax=Mytilus galloprovincialis TaxID=29158 RepID=A0A8B6F038_MYTGA|nr:Hypothetical predicted protein [Mytilus galloprovincialis]